MKKTVLFISLSMFIFFSCKENKMEVDVSDIKIAPIEILRLEKDLFSMDKQNIDVRTEEIVKHYGVVYDHYLMNPHRLNGHRDSSYRKAILEFIFDRDVREAYNDISKVYTPAVMDEIKDELEVSVKRFHHYFPERKLPARLITCVSGWNYAFAYMDSALILSLDMYMGEKSRFYQMLRYPQYQTRKMNTAHILPDVARGWLLTEFDNTKPENTLLHHTIFYGKLFYAVNALLPETADSLIIGYTGRQLKLCDQYEKQYWSYFAAKNRLYENNLMTIRELTSEGPFTGAISRECPPRIAMWIGWQIVKSYMKNNETVTLSDLMNEKDPQKILTKSKYRP